MFYDKFQTLHENILAGSSKKDGACLGVLAFGDECEVAVKGKSRSGNYQSSSLKLIADFLDLEETSASSNI